MNFNLVFIDSLDESLIGGLQIYDENDVQIFDSTGVQVIDFTVNARSGEIAIPVFDFPVGFGEESFIEFSIKLGDLKRDTVNIVYQLNESSANCEGVYYSDCKVYLNNNLEYDLSTDSNRRVFTIPTLRLKK